MSFISKLQSRFRAARDHGAESEPQITDLTVLEKKMSYVFSDSALLDLALTHPSFNVKDTSKPNNQRLEFLGDSILGAILSAELYHLYPHEKEGDLSRKKSFFARGSQLAELGRFLGLEEIIKMSPSERKNQGHKRESTLEDAVEAIVGAIYLDGGFEKTKACVLLWLGDLQLKLKQKGNSLNPKGKLQELIQARKPKEKIHYHLIDQKGPDHAKTFFVEVQVGGKKIANGQGNSKKDAETEAALRAIEVYLK